MSASTLNAGSPKVIKMNEEPICECGKETRFDSGNPTRGKNNWLMIYQCTDLDCLRRVAKVEQWRVRATGTMVRIE